MGPEMKLDTETTATRFTATDIVVALTFDDVLLVGTDDETHVGTPLVDGASVTGTIVDQDRDKKIIVFKYKSKTRYRRKNGHRQHYTELRVTSISI